MYQFISKVSEHVEEHRSAVDYTLATTLATAPVWSQFIEHVNGLLLMLSLIVGIAIGVQRYLANRREAKWLKDHPEFYGNNKGNRDDLP